MICFAMKFFRKRYERERNFMDQVIELRQSLRDLQEHMHELSGKFDEKYAPSAQMWNAIAEIRRNQVKYERGLKLAKPIDETIEYPDDSKSPNSFWPGSSPGGEYDSTEMSIIDNTKKEK